MQALLFEMKPHDGHEEHYFRHAAALRPILMQHEGLSFIERYKSLSRPGVILSHSLWRDEASITRWRTNQNHHQSQTAGRYKHFEDYRIRIAHALQTLNEHGGQEQWGTAGMYADASSAADRYITIIRSNRVPKAALGEAFESVSETGSFLSVAEFSAQEAGQRTFTEALNDDNTLSAILARMSRDYGMYERAEAPQYFRPVEKPGDDSCASN